MYSGLHPILPTTFVYYTFIPYILPQKKIREPFLSSVEALVSTFSTNKKKSTDTVNAFLFSCTKFENLPDSDSTGKAKTLLYM